MAVCLNLILFAGLFTAVPLACEGANVLGFFTSSSPSHIIIHMSYIKSLVQRGHNVTIVTTIPIKEKHTNLTHIYVPPSEEAQREMDELKSNIIKEVGALQLMRNMPKVVSQFSRASIEAIRDPRVQDLIHNPENKFDLMIMGYFLNDFELGVAAQKKCPIIISWMTASNIFIERYVGNPPEISYVPPSPFLPAANPLKFTGRLWNFFLFGTTKFLEWYIDQHSRSLYTELFPAQQFPPLAEVSKRVSLVFANSHFSEGIVRPNVPALVDVGGIQIKDTPDPLPENLRKFVESASKHGVIYVSFGSNLASSHMNSGFIQKIYKVLSGVKQTVLWKWDGKEKPGNASNIHFEKWLPQDDLLAHPNMRLFITHAGKGSVAESQYHGVPMVAIPLFAEQPSNAEKLVADGFGLQVDHLSMTSDDFRSTVMEVLQNAKYRENVQRFSRLYRDRPMTARETAAYWMEYVIRHQGAYHMQSPLVHLNGIQYLSLDVIGFLLLTACVVFKILKLLGSLMCKLVREKLYSKLQKFKDE